MSDDWSSGDLALLCVRSGEWFGPHDERPSDAAPEKGRIYTVRRVQRDPDGVWLELSDVELALWFAESFRKIHPDKREACEEEFVTLLKRSKRKVDA